jgi:S1-C subfamily serine protease
MVPFGARACDIRTRGNRLPPVATQDVITHDMSMTLFDVSASIAGLVESAAPLVAAIRVGQNRHITGIHWQPGIVVTADQSLPAQDTYTLILANGALASARPGSRDPSANLASLRLDNPAFAPGIEPGPDAPVGSLVLLLGADLDGSPTVRLTAVHRRARGGDTTGSWMTLDLPPNQADQGGPALDASGRLLGMTSLGPRGEAVIVPHGVIGRFAAPAADSHGAEPNRDRPGPLRGGMPMPTPMPTPMPMQGSGQGMMAPSPNGANPLAGTSGRRGWLGVALQPITVPDQLVQKAGQTSGRMVVSVSAAGPADRAGLRVGDVLLALDGYSTSGSHALRAFLGADRIGRQVEVRLLRDGSILSTFLTVAAQPAGQSSGSGGGSR